MTATKIQQEPIACTLPAQELPEHLAFIRREVLDKATRVEELPEGYRLYFAADPALRQRLQELIAIEAGCCASLRFVLAESDGKLALEIGGAVGIKQALHEILPLGERVRQSRWKRWGKSVAAVAAVAVVSLVVCELPLLLLLLGLGGAAVSVDAIGEIWTVALVVGLSLPLLYWIWRRRGSRDLSPK